METHGILLSEFQLQTARFTTAVVGYLQQELANDPEVCGLLLTRVQQAYGNLRTKLTARQIDEQFHVVQVGR